VDRLAEAVPDVPPALAIHAARIVIANAREGMAGGAVLDVADLRRRVAELCEEMIAGSLTRVINATGVILHTNLGRAPLADAAAEAVAAVACGYSNLEYDLQAGERSSRGVHVESLVRELVGAEAAMAVNNNAGAVLLALSASASNRDVIVSRGQLVEIGGSFRIPDIMKLSTARLVEVGTTNRTRMSDYSEAITAEAGALLRVHQSNFRTVGFVEQASLQELCELAHENGLVVIDDLGSGALTSIGDEPLVEESLAAGADLVCFSADKLLGGPQAGLICGSRRVVDLCRCHPLARALRLDKLQLAALAATLRLLRDDPGAIPLRRMLKTDEATLMARVNALVEAIGSAATITQSAGRPGGGTLPLCELPGPVCQINPGPSGANRLHSRLRLGRPPVISRIHHGQILLDPRTMDDDEIVTAAAAVRQALEP
jgi:L-seryl-tRNA(Ser) seleniumtransferase